eukprot:TRINITY_DN12000_c0_g1_i1.p1 TRINITY_DN12000_c0_g1~~TRINITY_DN12000_c0_g1_i1.p1  ORF type:complete len:567 (+),score=99.36 TRINITY_DN12000_c0_g1_i1:213-1703(+)
MTETLTEAGVTHVCFGNHEADISNESLKQRIEEFVARGGIWINTNMRKYEIPLPDYDSVDVTSKDGTHTRKVGLLGLLLNTPKIMKSTSFGGALGTDCCDISNVNETALSYKKKLSDHDIIVPLTHQELAADRSLARSGEFPIILGGHEHDTFYEWHNYHLKDKRSLIIKAGQDAHYAAVIDIVWEDATSKIPTVTYEVHSLKQYAPDEHVTQVVKRNYGILYAMEKSVIYTYPGPNLLSSREVRLHETTMGTLLCTACKTSLGCDAVFLNGGTIRGNKDYTKGLVTLADVRTELFYDTNILVVDMLGRDVSDIVAYTRRNEGIDEAPYYFHGDDGIVVDKDKHHVTHIAGKPIVLDMVYKVGFNCDVMLEKVDNVVPLLKWVACNAHNIPPRSSQQPSKILVLKYFGNLLWQKLPAFDSIDKDKSGTLSIEEVTHAYGQIFDFDQNGDGKIDETESRARDEIIKVLMGVFSVKPGGVITKQQYESWKKQNCLPDH